MSSEGIEKLFHEEGGRSFSLGLPANHEDKLKKEVDIIQKRNGKKSSTSSIGSSPYISFFSESPRSRTLSETYNSKSIDATVPIVVTFDETEETNKLESIENEINDKEERVTLRDSLSSPRRAKRTVPNLIPSLSGSQIFEQYQLDISERTQRGSEDESSSPTSLSPRTSMRGRKKGVHIHKRRLSDSEKLASNFERNVTLRRSWNVCMKSESRGLPPLNRDEGKKGLKSSLHKLGRKIANKTGKLP